MFLVIGIVGSLGVFFFGMRVMSEAVQKSAGRKMQSVLTMLTSNRLTGVLTGFSITALIQSSSATTIILVSFVNAGLLQLNQAFGIVMGANIGTTVTAWIVSIFGFRFDISSIAMPAIAAGLPLLFSRNIKLRYTGEFLTGFGLLFLGIALLKMNTSGIESDSAVLDLLRSLASYGYLSFLIYIFAGLIITVIIQSSSAAMALTITMAFRDWIQFDTACGMVLGINIGTTVTALLASAGMSIGARRTAYSHTIFNIAGVLWMLTLVDPMCRFIDMIIPGSVSEPYAIPLHLAAFHSIFNIMNALLFLPFVPCYTGLIERIFKDRDSRLSACSETGARSAYPSFVDSNYSLAKREIARLSQNTYDILLYFLNAMDGEREGLFDMDSQINTMIRRASQMPDEISTILARCRTDNDEDKGRDINSLMRIVSELDSMCAGCGRLVELLRQREIKQLAFHEGAEEQIIFFAEEVLDFIRFNTDAMQQDFKLSQIEIAEKMEGVINEKRDELRKKSRKKMEKGADIRGELVFMDIVRHIEHLGDFSIGISRILQGMNL